MQPRKLQIVIYGLIVVAGAIATGVTVAVMNGKSTADEVNTIVAETGYFGVPSIGEAARRAALVAIAEVEQPLEPFWNTSDGQRPNVSDRELALMPSARIFTPHVLSITDVLKGAAPDGNQLVLNHLGGQVGSDRVVLDDDPLSFEQEAIVLVFLSDCGSERVERLGSEGFRYVLISRYEIDGEDATLGDSRVPKDEVLATVESNKSGEPQAEASC